MCSVALATSLGNDTSKIPLIHGFYSGYVKPSLLLLFTCITVTATISGMCAIAIYFELIVLPIAPFLIVFVAGSPLGIVGFIILMHPSVKEQQEESIILQRSIPGNATLNTDDFPSNPRSLPDACNYIARTYYGRPRPGYEEIEVIPGRGGQRTKWVALPDEQKWKMLKEGSKGTGGREAVSKIQDLLNRGESLSDPGVQAIMRKRICSGGRISEIHGAGHAQRCAALAAALASRYEKIFQLPALTEEELIVLQITAMFHDSGRQGDGSDVWEEDSAQNAETFLRRAGFAESLCMRAGNAIRGEEQDDPLTILLGDADRLEYMRLCTKDGSRRFDEKHLRASSMRLPEGVSEESRGHLIKQIVVVEEQFITSSDGFDVNYEQYVECLNEIFRSTSPALPAEEKILQRVAALAESASHFAGKIGMVVPSEIALLRTVKSQNINWRAIEGDCRSVLRELGRDIANESIVDAIQFGRDIESILIWCCAVMGGNIHQEKLTPFKSGLFSQTYTFSIGGNCYVFKPIIPKNDPNERDMERRYGISQFTHVAREMAPQKLNELLCLQGAKRNIPVPRLYGNTRMGVVDGTPGLIMERASGSSLQNAQDENATRCNPNFRKEETYLQLLDCILGQYDRHNGNVFWGNCIRAIDNDISFSDLVLRLSAKYTDRNGRFPVTPQMLAYAKTIDLPDCIPLQLRERRAVDGLAGPWNYCMPPVIDSEMRAIFLAINEDDLCEILRADGFTDNQISATINRVKSLKGHINSGHIRIIAPDAFGSDPLPECTPQNTYFMWHTQ
ncbi:MAG: HD domain-containing protein [Puniceicoccales bacterium]|jgi:hypothetical protein|nr:HD domain-containing protein [Puniceicoccales bacterium]